MGATMFGKPFKTGNELSYLYDIQARLSRQRIVGVEWLR